MTADAPNKLHRRLCQELAKQLSEHRVLLVFDPGQQLRPFLDEVATAPPSGNELGSLNLGEQQTGWAVAGSSLYELRSQLEPHVAADLPDPLLVYLPDRQESEGRAVLWSCSALAPPSRSSWSAVPAATCVRPGKMTSLPLIRRPPPT